MTDITVLLDKWQAGDPQAFADVLPLVYPQLRLLARSCMNGERGGHTLQPTALVHEAYLRLSGLRQARPSSRAHFFGVTAHVMRRVLVDHARERNADKRGGAGAVRVTLNDAIPGSDDADESLQLDLIALDDALTALAELSPVRASVVELRYFGGLSVDEVGAHLDLSSRTVKRHWQFARAWLVRRLSVQRN